MHAYFSQDIGRRHVSLVHRLGGAGKTQICLKFLDKTDKSRFTDVFFLDANGIDTIKNGLKNIALTWSIRRMLLAGSLHLRMSDDPSINLFNYFPRSSSGNILITSPNPELSVHVPNSHHRISDMEEEDAVQLLLASALQPLSTETESLATDMVKALYCFPLAVVQAGSFIARTGTLRKYLALYKQNCAKLLSMLPPQSHDKYAWLVYTTWDISFRIWDELEFAEMIAEIRGYSLINQDPNTNLFSIHPLVHDWSSKTITDTTSTQQCCAAILAVLTMSLEDDQVFLISLLPRTNSVLREDRQLAHKFPYPYQCVFYDSGHFDRTQELCVARLENRKHILGSDHLETLFVMQDLVVIYWHLGKFTDAKELGVAVLEKMKQILGSEHPDTLAALSDLAAIYRSLGKFMDAEELEVAVLEKSKQILGSEHPDTLAAMSNLAVTYQKLGKFTDAEELNVAALEKREQLFGTEHPETLTSMTNLALTYRDMGKFTEAEHLLVTVLEQKTSTLGPEHKETLQVQKALAEMRKHIEHNNTG
ncbi:hypothetical protein C8J57DRAFT_1459170 [Mycena rebaudengoi]|nr:hypothetical protein C8J57DRAFT_1459170 [Mycena rebaudengoi]